MHYHDGINADGILRDLAETYLGVGELDQGLAMFAALLRNDPADIWTYNVITLPGIGSRPGSRIGQGPARDARSTTA